MLTDAKVAGIKPPAAGQEEHRDNKVTGLRLRVGAGGKKVWIVRARVGAKVVNKKLGTYPQMGLASARSTAERLLAALARDGGAEAVDRTFAAVADFWIAKVAQPNNSSWQMQKRQLEMHVLPSWKDRKIAGIKRADVRELLDGIEGAVLPNRVLAVIKTIFRYAVSRDWIEASPVEGIKAPKQEAGRDRVLDMDEITRVWEASALLGYPYGLYVRVLLLTAQRRSEVAAMRWDDVDTAEATWSLRSEATKAERAHLVPLSAPALEIVKALPRLGPYVFTTDGKTYFQGFSKAKQRLDEYMAAHGPMAAWTLHDLRRSAATHMVRLGITTEVVGRVLNHAPQGITAKVYALHEFVPEKRRALDTWAAEVMRAVGWERGENVIALGGR